MGRGELNTVMLDMHWVWLRGINGTTVRSIMRRLGDGRIAGIMMLMIGIMSTGGRSGVSPSRIRLLL
jgi:hypothetical protein